MDTIGKRLRWAITDLRIDAAELSARSGQSPSVVSQWMNDKVSPEHAKYVTAADLARGAEITIEFLMTGAEPRRPDVHHAVREPGAAPYGPRQVTMASLNTDVTALQQAVTSLAAAVVQLVPGTAEVVLRAMKAQNLDIPVDKNFLADFVGIVQTLDARRRQASESQFDEAFRTTAGDRRP